MRNALAKSLILGWILSASAIAWGETGDASQGPKALNPEIAVDGLFSLSQFNTANPIVFDGGHDAKWNGINLQQVELTFGANVDPYLRGDVNLVFTSEGVEVEEAYATTMSLPWNLQLKAGQFFTAFGRNNPTHPHAWDWANKPLVLGRFFGGDGLRNPGLQASWLTPLPWFSEIIVSGQNSFGGYMPSFLGDVGKTQPSLRSPADYLLFARTNNFFPLTDNLSLNVGANYATGPNAVSPWNTRTSIIGGDLFIKYREPDSLSFFALQAEWLRRFYDVALNSPAADSGWYAQLSWRLGEPWERWIVGLRFDHADANPTPVFTDFGAQGRDTAERWRLSPVVTFYPTEFSKVRLQYDYDRIFSQAYAQQDVQLQLEFLMGAHGAHKF